MKGCYVRKGVIKLIGEVMPSGIRGIVMKSEIILDVFDLPYDTAITVPKITVMGTERVIVENFISLEEYNTESVKLKCKRNVIELCGRDFAVKNILLQKPIWGIRCLLDQN